MYLSSTASRFCTPAQYHRDDAKIFTVLLDKEQEDIVQEIGKVFTGPEWTNEFTRDLLILDRWLGKKQPAANHSLLLRKTG
jgi:hypothetical protein